jgi:hypothetical protein
LDNNTYGGDVYLYAFGTPVMDEDSIDLCWELDAAQPDGVSQDAEKFSVVLCGDLSYSFGTVEPYTVVEDAEVCIDYSTTETCIEIDLGMVEAEVWRPLLHQRVLPSKRSRISLLTSWPRSKGLIPLTKHP